MEKSLHQKSREAREWDQVLDKTQYWKRAITLIQGEAIYHLKKDNLYKFVQGEGGIDSWEDYCKEKKLNKDTSDKAELLYKRFVIMLGFKIDELLNYEPTSLLALSPFVGGGTITKENIKNWLEKAEALTVEDLKKELGQMKFPQEDHKHKIKVYCICLECKQTFPLICPSCGYYVKSITIKGQEK